MGTTVSLLVNYGQIFEALLRSVERRKSILQKNPLKAVYTEGPSSSSAALINSDQGFVETYNTAEKLLALVPYFIMLSSVLWA